MYHYFVILFGIKDIEVWGIHYFMEHCIFWEYFEFIVIHAAKDELYVKVEEGLNIDAFTIGDSLPFLESQNTTRLPLKLFGTVIEI